MGKFERRKDKGKECNYNFKNIVKIMWELKEKDFDVNF